MQEHTAAEQFTAIRRNNGKSSFLTCIIKPKFIHYETIFFAVYPFTSF